MSLIQRWRLILCSIVRKPARRASYSTLLDWRVLSGRSQDRLRLRGFLKQGGGEAFS
jgi:hypothetical protein